MSLPLPALMNVARTFLMHVGLICAILCRHVGYKENLKQHKGGRENLRRNLQFIMFVPETKAMKRVIPLLTPHPDL